MLLRHKADEVTVRSLLKKPNDNKNGGWSGWAEWAHCRGFPSLERRVRYCNNPLPELGGSCTGADEEHKPCEAYLYWTLLKQGAKMSTAIKAKISVRSKTDCCTACLMYAECRGVSYSKTTSSCIVANPAASSFEDDDNWDTWIKN
ncbi:abnormal cell migration protein 21-like [Haliotis rubra]|uniref:abnormal cell migration protein 21-like n=1 Tax=Haliotis rubra TaxID=36100 RepID=UPI001EE5CBEA|nr:abnormal cell migration protein 21-like [Haliotis rubra]